MPKDTLEEIIAMVKSIQGLATPGEDGYYTDECGLLESISNQSKILLKFLTGGHLTWMPTDALQAERDVSKEVAGEAQAEAARHARIQELEQTVRWGTLIRERDKAERERARALIQRDSALEALAAARAERDKALAERDKRALAKKDADAVRAEFVARYEAELRGVSALRDAALAKRDEALKERAEASALLPMGGAVSNVAGPNWALTGYPHYGGGGCACGFCTGCDA